jgi:hypothetical protein
MFTIEMKLIDRMELKHQDHLEGKFILKLAPKSCEHINYGASWSLFTTVVFRIRYSSKRTPSKRTKRQEFGDFRTVRSSKRTKRGVDF